MEIVLLVTILDECFTAHDDFGVNASARASVGVTLFIIL